VLRPLAGAVAPVLGAGLASAPPPRRVWRSTPSFPAPQRPLTSLQCRHIRRADFTNHNPRLTANAWDKSLPGHRARPSNIQSLHRRRESALRPTLPQILHRHRPPQPASGTLQFAPYTLPAKLQSDAPPYAAKSTYPLTRYLSLEHPFET